MCIYFEFGSKAWHFSMFVVALMCIKYLSRSTLCLSTEADLKPDSNKQVHSITTTRIPKMTLKQILEAVYVRYDGDWTDFMSDIHRPLTNFEDQLRNVENVNESQHAAITDYQRKAESGFESVQRIINVVRAQETTLQRLMEYGVDDRAIQLLNLEIARYEVQYVQEMVSVAGCLIGVVLSNNRHDDWAITLSGATGALVNMTDFASIYTDKFSRLALHSVPLPANGLIQ